MEHIFLLQTPVQFMLFAEQPALGAHFNFLSSFAVIYMRRFLPWEISPRVLPFWFGWWVSQAGLCFLAPGDSLLREDKNGALRSCGCGSHAFPLAGQHREGTGAIQQQARTQPLPGTGCMILSHNLVSLNLNFPDLYIGITRWTCLPECWSGLSEIFIKCLTWCLESSSYHYLDFYHSWSFLMPNFRHTVDVQ